MILGALLIASLVIIGVMYGSMWKENKALKGEFEQKYAYNPSRAIFICAGRSRHMMKLMGACTQAHLDADVKVQERQLYTVLYENGDEVWCLTDGAQINALTQEQVAEKRTRVFFDSALPDSAIRAWITQLGLMNYMIEFGICDENCFGGQDGEDVC